MRAALTDSEARLWAAIRGRRLGVAFRRQVVIETFIVDFLAPSSKALQFHITNHAILLKTFGGVHEEQQFLPR
jgi:very-short-patch-repair endonuclease